MDAGVSGPSKMESSASIEDGVVTPASEKVGDDVQSKEMAYDCNCEVRVATEVWRPR